MKTTKENKTKKNWVLRIASVALMFTLVSTCLMSGTLAKYVRAATGTDSARVAKFGVTVASTPGLFSPSYTTDETGVGAYVGLAVQSNNNSDKVVAPGTTGTATGFTISGTPEVAVRVKVTVDDANSSLGAGWITKDGLDAYEPVKWTINKGGVPVVGASNLSFADLKTKLSEISNDYAPNTTLESKIGDVYTITWVWPFTTAGNDENDTYLGDEAANGATDLTINLKFNVSVTQID